MTAVSRAPRRAAQHAVDARRSAGSAPRRPRRVREAVGEHAHDRVELVARRGRGTAQRAANAARTARRAFHSRHADLGDDLLRQHVERLRGTGRSRRARRGATRVEQRRALDAGRRATAETAAPSGCAPSRVAGAADALQEGGDRARRAELADEVDVADVDAELERSRGHQRLQLAGLSRCSASSRCSLREAAVVRGDVRPRRAARRDGARRARRAGAC